MRQPGRLAHLGQAEQAQRVVAPAPGVSHPLVGVQDQEVLTCGLEPVSHREPGGAAPITIVRAVMDCGIAPPRFGSNVWARRINPRRADHPTRGARYG